MGKQHQKQREAVTVIIDSTTIFISWIQTVGTKPHIRACKQYDVLEGEVVDGTIYNASRLQKTVTDFLRSYRIMHLPLALTVHGGIFNEQWLKTPTATPSMAELGQHTPHMIWESRYIGPTSHHDGFWHYVCGISREHLFHYQLFGMFAQLNVRILTSPTMAHIAFYKHIYGTAFRHTQLTIDLEKHNYNLMHAFSPELVTRSAYAGTNAMQLSGQHYLNHATSIGLFLAGE